MSLSGFLGWGCYRDCRGLNLEFFEALVPWLTMESILPISNRYDCYQSFSLLMFQLRWVPALSHQHFWYSKRISTFICLEGVTELHLVSVATTKALVSDVFRLLGIDVMDFSTLAIDHDTLL